MPYSTWCCGTPSPAVRPDDVLAGLRRVAGLERRPARRCCTRLAQGPLDAETGTVGDPLTSDA